MDTNTRKQQIVDAALKLFSESGFQATPTALIAKEAKVSEALIFKHFGNKNKLLLHIIKSGYENAVEYSRRLLQENDPHTFISKTIDLPLLFVNHDPLFWKLQKRLMAELDFAQKQHDRFILPMHRLLQNAFTELGYAEPEKETRVILMLVDCLWKSLVVGKPDRSIKETTLYIKNKYSISKSKNLLSA